VRDEYGTIFREKEKESCRQDEGDKHSKSDVSIEVVCLGPAELKGGVGGRCFVDRY
jgi:hypothetical protein